MRYLSTIKRVLKYVIPIIVIQFLLISYTNRGDNPIELDSVKIAQKRGLTEFSFSVNGDELVISFRYGGRDIESAEVALTELNEDNFAWPVIRQSETRVDSFITLERGNYMVVCSIHPPVLRDKTFFFRQLKLKKKGSKVSIFGEDELEVFGQDLIFKWKLPEGLVNRFKIRKPQLLGFNMMRDTHKNRAIIEYTIHSTNLIRYNREEKEIEVTIISEDKNEIQAVGADHIDGRHYEKGGATYRAYIPDSETRKCYELKAILAAKHRILFTSKDFDSIGLTRKFCV